MIIRELVAQNAIDELKAVVEQQREQANVPDGKPEQITTPVVTEPVILPEYAIQEWFE